MNGAMPEWLMGTDCKSVGFAYAGSNPARPILNSNTYIGHSYFKKINKKGFYIYFFEYLQIICMLVYDKYDIFFFRI